MTDSEKVFSETERQKDKTLRIDERSKDKDIRVKERQKDVDTRQAEVESTEKYNYETLRKNQRMFTNILKLFTVVMVITLISIATLLLSLNHFKTELHQLQNDNYAQVTQTKVNHTTGLQNQAILCKIYLENNPKNAVCQ